MLLLIIKHSAYECMSTYKFYEFASWLLSKTSHMEMSTWWTYLLLKVNKFKVYFSYWSAIKEFKPSLIVQCAKPSPREPDFSHKPSACGFGLVWEIWFPWAGFDTLHMSEGLNPITQPLGPTSDRYPSDADAVGWISVQRRCRPESLCL